MENKKNILLLAIIVILIIVFGGVIYFAKKNNNDSCQFTKYKNYDWSNLDERYQAGLDETFEALCSDPKNLNQLNELASYLKYNKDTEGSIELLDNIMKDYPSDVLSRNNKMNVLYDQKKYNEAEDMAYEIIDINSQWFNAYQLLRDVYKYHKKDIYKTDKFPDLILRGIKLDARKVNLSSYYAMLGGYYQDIDNKEKAIEYYEKLYEQKPEEYIMNQINELKQK